MTEHSKSYGKARIASKKQKHLEVRELHPNVEVTTTSRHSTTNKSINFNMMPLDESSPIGAQISKIIAKEIAKEEEPSNEAWIRQVGEETADELEAIGLPRIPTLYDGNWYCFDKDGNWRIGAIDFNSDDIELKKNKWVYS